MTQKAHWRLCSAVLKSAYWGYVVAFGMLGYFSIPAGEFSLNPFAGEGFNALGDQK